MAKTPPGRRPPLTPPKEGEKMHPVPTCGLGGVFARMPLWRKCSAGSLVAKEIYPIVWGFSNSKVESAITHMVRLIINCTAICCPGVDFARMLLKLKMNPMRNPDVEYAFIING
jgi:hypothetical protein